MIHFKVKKIILESGLKQSYIAQQLGIDQGQLSKKIYGHMMFSESERARLAEILGTTEKELFVEEAA